MKYQTTLTEKLKIFCHFVLIFSITLETHADNTDKETFAAELRGMMFENHLVGLENWEVNIREQLETAAASQFADQESEAGIADFNALLNANRLELPDLDKLQGQWRVRSLQANDLGAYRYPFFRLKIYSEGRTLVLHKDTGSQRRMGVIVPNDPSKALFVGASYYDYESQPRSYSGYIESPTKEDTERDSVGYLFKIDTDHYFLAFIRNQFGAELYEIRK